MSKFSAHNNIIRPIWGRTDTAKQSIWIAKIDTSLIFPPPPPPDTTDTTDTTNAVKLLSRVIIDNEFVYPNPFFGSTCISFKLKQPTRVSLYVTDVYGRKIAVLKEDEELQPGKHLARFNADAYAVPAGVYYFNLVACGVVKTQKIVLTR